MRKCALTFAMLKNGGSPYFFVLSFLGFKIKNAFYFYHHLISGNYLHDKQSTANILNVNMINKIILKKIVLSILKMSYQFFFFFFFIILLEEHVLHVLP